MMDSNGRRIFLYRHTRNGRSQVVPCTVSFMTMSDLPEAERLHYDATNGLSREIFMPTPTEDLVRLLGDEGFSLGVWFEGKLISMRSVVTGKEWMDETLEKMGFQASESNRTAFTDHCIVDREFRGNDVQFLTHYWIEDRIAEQFDSILTTVAPRNIFSLQNILACNFLIVGLKEMYGGHLRYIMSKHFSADVPIWTNGHLVIPITDVERQQRVVAANYVGYKSIRKHRGFSILYAPVGTEPPQKPKMKKMD